MMAPFSVSVSLIAISVSWHVKQQGSLVQLKQPLLRLLMTPVVFLSKRLLLKKPISFCYSIIHEFVTCVTDQTEANIDE